MTTAITRTPQTVTNPQWFDAGHTSITCSVVWAELESMGALPFHATPDDTETHGVNLYNQLVAGVYGAVAEYAAPVPTVAQLVAYVSTSQQASLSAGKTVNVAASGAAALNVLCDGLSATRADLGLMVDNAQANPGSSITWLDNNGVISTLTAAEVIQLTELIGTWVDNTYGAAGTLLSGIKATPPTVTTFAQIDAAFAALAAA